MIKKLILVFLLLIFPAITHAQESSLNLKQEKINPGSSLFAVKRLTEKIHEKLIFSEEKKVAFAGSLLEKRMSELNFIVNNKHATPIERASQRFSAQAGVYVDGLVKIQSKDKESSLNTFEDYKILLGKLRDNFPANDAYWLLLQQNIDTLNILSEKIKV